MCNSRSQSDQNAWLNNSDEISTEIKEIKTFTRSETTSKPSRIIDPDEAQFNVIQH